MWRPKQPLSHAACRWADSEELSEDEDLWAEMREFWSDGEEVDGVGRAPARRARKGPRKPRAPGQPRGGGQAYSKLRHQIVTHYNAVTQVCVPGACRVLLSALPCHHCKGSFSCAGTLGGHALVIPVMHA